MLRYWPRFVAACRRRYGKVFTLRVSGVGTHGLPRRPRRHQDRVRRRPGRVPRRRGELDARAGSSATAPFWSSTTTSTETAAVLMMRAFHRDAVARQADVMAEIAAANIAKWPVGKRVTVAPRMAAITLEIILRTVIGATDPARLAALRDGDAAPAPVGALNTLAIANPRLQRRRPWHGCGALIARPIGCCTPRSPNVAPTPMSANRADVLAMLVRAAGDGGQR